VSGTRVARGYAIEITDQGLGMPPELMYQLNERLSRVPEFDLANSDQLGLLVVSQLAARHGIMVSLRPSTYGGTIAIALFPSYLVADETQVVMPAAPPVREMRRPREAPTGPRIAAEPVDGLPRRQRQAAVAWETATPSAEALPERHAQPAQPTQPAASEQPERSERPERPERSAEHARSLTSAIQQGWRAGRAADDGGR
jgi:hypothetical protein